MNIFYLDVDPKKAAEYHCDRHVVSQIKESAQMLSTCHRVFGHDEGYKATHVNHPCNVWIRESYANYRWLKVLVFYLHEEWRRRYSHSASRIHKSVEVIQSLREIDFSNVGHTKPALAMPEHFRTNCPITSYRNYYLGAKAEIAKWRLGAPEWWNDGNKD